MIRTEVVDTIASFMKLHDAWDELVQSTEVDHAFMRHLWFSEIIKAYFASNSLAIVTVWRDGQLAAAAPLLRTSYRFRGLKAKAISFISTEITPRCNFIAIDNELLRPLFDSVIKLGGWDILYLKNLEEEAAVTKAIIDLARNDFSDFDCQVIDGHLSPYLRTEGTWDDYWHSFSAKRRYTLTKYGVKRLQEAENSELVRIETEEQLKQFMPSMFKISAASWKAKSNSHLRRGTSEGMFYVGFTPKALARENVLIYAVKIDGRYIGFDYCLRCGSSYTGVRSDYDEAFGYYSPGNNLKMAILRQLFENNDICEFDLGGEAHKYKLDWGHRVRRHLAITIGNNTPKGKFILTGKTRILPFLRSVGRKLTNSNRDA